MQQALRHPHRHPHRHPWLRRGSIAVAAGVALLLVLSVIAYVKLNGNITQIDVSKLLGQRPSNSASANKLTNLKPVNILVIGSDSRELGTSAFGTTKQVEGGSLGHNPDRAPVRRPTVCGRGQCPS